MFPDEVTKFYVRALYESTDSNKIQFPTISIKITPENTYENKIVGLLQWQLSFSFVT